LSGPLHVSGSRLSSTAIGGDERVFASVKRLSRDTLVLVILGILTLFAFQPAVKCGFNLVDDVVVGDQPHVKTGLSAANLRWAFTTREVGYPIPITLTSFMIDVDLFGLNPSAFHAENVAWHVADVALVYLLLKRITGCTWRSAVVTALFAVHPLRTESVAWITERKDVLAAFFGLLAMHAYVSYARRPSWIRYAAVFMLFAISLFAKPMLLMLPALLLALDFWPLKRLTVPLRPPAKLLLEKLPLAALAAFSAWLGTQAQAPREMMAKHLPFSSTASNATVAYVRYLMKMVDIRHLALCYPLVPHWPVWCVAGAAGLLIAISVITLSIATRWPWLVVGWVWYVAILMPAAGFYALGDASMADRYTYFPMIGLLIMLVYSLPPRLPRTAWRWPAVTVFTAIAVALVFATRAQCLIWQNDITLFTRSVNTAGPSELACADLAIALSRAHSSSEAISYYQQALTINPKNGPVQGDMALALDEIGRRADAIPHYLKAIEADPTDVGLQYNMGTDLVDLGRAKEAVPYLQRAVELSPSPLEPRANLATALLRSGDYDGAIREAQSVLTKQPGAIGVRETLAAALANSGQIDAAQQQYLLLIVNDHNNVNAYNALGAIYIQKRKPAAALYYLKEAVRLNPSLATVRNNLGVALIGTGQADAAVTEFRKALEIDPDYEEAKRNLELAGGKR
jgi:Flp pilus assembly protein TadD